jgi:hypothetical protein
MVQVILDFRGGETTMVVRESISEKDFKKAAKQRLSVNPKAHTRIVPLGLDTLGVRAGYTYAVFETRKMTITLNDVKGKRRSVSIAGSRCNV